MEIEKIVLAFLIVLCVHACQKNKSTNIEVYGKWFQNTPWEKNLFLYHEYDFKQDGTLEILASAIDSTSKERKGYVRKMVGTYYLKGDSLILKDQKVFAAGSNTYKKLNELTYQVTYERTAYKPIYNARKDTLTLLFNCPANADCIPYPRLTRVK